MKQSLLTDQHSQKHLLYSFLPYLKRKRILFCWILPVILLVIAAILSFSNAGNSCYLPYEQHVEVLSHHDGLHIAIDDTLLDRVIAADKYQKLSNSLDGNIAAFLTDTKELYLVQNRKLKKIADDVLHFEISSSGMGVAFAQKYAEQYALTLYSVKDETRREITALLSKLDFSLSPDGQTLAYYSFIENQDTLMCHCKGEELIICRDNADLVGLSNDGNYIYAVCRKITGTSSLYAFSHRGKSVELGTVTSISFKFNADHEQIMFYNNGKTLVSVNGQPASKVSSYPLYLVTAPNSRSSSDGNSITLPVTTLFDHIYTCSDGETTSAWLIRKNPERSEKMVSRVSGCTLDVSGRYLYYIQDLSHLCTMKVTNGASHAYLLAENVDTYAVCSNRCKVYYIDDGTLYCTSGRKSGTPKLISTDITGYNLAMGDSDAIYYLSNSNLYISKNGHKGNLAAKNIQSVYSSSNNVVYIIGEGEIYTAYSKKHAVKVLETTVDHH